MKILVVSLLRLGDLLMTAPVLAGLRQKFPNAEIDVLSNGATRSAQGLLPTVRNFYTFDRDGFQAELADPDQPLLQPFFRLEGLVQGLQHNKYDLVINLTHNRLSGWLTSLIQGKEVLGLALDPQGRPQFGSPWFQYLNDRADLRGKEIFHFIDIFRFGSGLSGEPVSWNFKRSREGRDEAAALTTGEEGPLILIQPFTSEEKKEWGLERWVHGLDLLAQHQSKATFFILGSPAETAKVEALTAALAKVKVRAKPAICSLAGALALLDQAQLLITGDTSIKHLAADTACPVLELSLGSSDWRRTGIYKPGAIIVQSEVACAPCLHSTPCERESQVCAEWLAPDVVADVAHLIITRDEDGLNHLARRTNRQVTLSRTHFSGGDHWQAVALGRSLRADDLREWLDKLTIKLLFQGVHLQRLGPYGTEAMKLGAWLRREFPRLPAKTWESLIHEVDGESRVQQEEALDAGVRLSSLVKASRSSPTVELAEMRRLQLKIKHAERRLDIRRRLMRSLKDAVEAVI